MVVSVSSALPGIQTQHHGRFIQSRFRNPINAHMDTGKKRPQPLSFVALISVFFVVATTTGCVNIGGAIEDKGSQMPAISTVSNDSDERNSIPFGVTPFLMFQGKKAQEAIDFYVDVIPDSRIDEIEHWGDANPQFSDGIMFATVTIGGQEVKVSDSPIEHAFNFTPSFSFLVECESEEELESLAASLEEDGEVLMPIGSYGFSEKFTFIEDRFGVSWQLVYW